MKIIDKRERSDKKNKEKKKQRGDECYSDSVRAKKFCYMFKLSFIQLICKASLGFKSNLGLALSIILKEENYTSQSMLCWSVNV